MAIGKITFRGVELPKEQPKAKVENNAPEVDEKMSTATKCMIGASAIAGLVMLGIAGRNGYFGKGVQKMLGGVKKNADDIAGHARKPKGETPNAKAEPEKVVQPKDEATKTEVEPLQPKQQTSVPLRPVEEIDGTDFSKLEGEVDENGNKVIKDSAGNVVRRFVPTPDRKSLHTVRDYNVDTGKEVKLTGFREDGKTLSWMYDYEPNTDNCVKYTSFRADGKKVFSVIEYDPKIKDKQVQRIFYKEDGTNDRTDPAPKTE